MTVHRSAINSLTPEMYKVPVTRLNMVNHITSTNQTIKKELDRYVGGVYMKVTVSSNNTSRVEFVNSTGCEQLFPDAD